ncbi:sigma-70 family RNA polymerase sigma factor [Desulfosporosinus metallidurans]|uniref:RNA polymerase sigma factor, sigma-70 family n=1 Tax=Desulfosporosinus metallidurans TaxID=1888891 RepID=A0A1Q8QWQ7_9FIRM|nr:sigma-70 family RNA polymerase sigma factor [Desulfosporosinus metallidurans]OLN31746.1 hypothetical protein DSOL_2434 [Desulfosporosinus metallidurans]
MDDGSTKGRIINIVTKLKSGDQQAFEELYELTHNKVYFLALKMVRNHENALDIVQEIYISVYKSIDKLINPEVFNAWLSKIVVNKCKDFLGKKKDVLLPEKEEYEDNDASEAIEDTSDDFIPHEVLDKSETRNMIMALIDNLPEAQRTTLLLHYYQGLNVEEIAAIMECPAATVKSRLIYSRRQIKTGVEGYEKQGVKLYNVAVVPLIIFILEAYAKENALGPEAAAKILSTVNAGVHIAHAVTAQTAASASKFRLLHKFTTLSIRSKIIAGIVAVAVAVTAIVTPIAVMVNANANQVMSSSSMPAIQQGNWIYYVWGYYNGAKTRAIFKMRTDGTQKTKICNDFGSDLVASGDWLYYSNQNDNDSLYKINTDGTERTKLNSDNSDSLIVLGGWIYYQNVSENNNLFKIRTDGSSRTKLNSESTGDFSIVGDWIFYRGSSNYNKGLYKIRTDGTEKTYLNNQTVLFQEFVGDSIYFLGDNFELLKMKTDGTGITIISTDEVNSFYVSGDWIYYCNSGDNFYLYKIKTDGSNKTQLNSEASCSVYVSGDWVYYTSLWTGADVGYFCKIKTDGTTRTLLSHEGGVTSINVE